MAASTIIFINDSAAHTKQSQLFRHDKTPAGHSDTEPDLHIDLLSSSGIFRFLVAKFQCETSSWNQPLVYNVFNIQTGRISAILDSYASRAITNCQTGQHIYRFVIHVAKIRCYSLVLIICFAFCWKCSGNRKTRTTSDALLVLVWPWPMMSLSIYLSASQQWASQLTSQSCWYTI